MKCTFCDVPNLKFKGNASFEDLKKQLYNAISLFPKTKYTERLNLHYARMGDPIFNKNVFDFSRWIYENKRQVKKDTGLSIEVIHPVLTTSLPVKFAKLEERIMEWCDIKNNLYNGQAGFQFSINSTDENQRTEMYRGMQIHLEDFARIAEKMPEPVSRKYCLNFAFSTDFIIDADKVANLFDSEKFMCKITPIHNNTACTENGIKTVGGYDSWKPYQKPEEDLKAKGFDVLVFVPSIDEEDGLVTCGNLILGGSKLKYNEELIKIEGL
jgi:23S rRNA (adenine2503-C2)-methyltransferase